LHTQTKKVITPKLAKLTNFDQDTWIDINRIKMVVTNRGSYCYNWITGRAGLEYPKGSGKYAIFSAGIWVIAQVENSLRAVIADYGTEWGPGPMKEGTFVPDNPDFQVLKITKGDGPENPDYMHWMNKGKYLGAPVYYGGIPIIQGDQTVWTVFNDANPALHTDGAGSTQPLGIEAQMTVFGFDGKGPIGNVVYIKWKIINKGSNYLKDAYFGLWFDPDLGSVWNDYVGCNPDNNFVFCYNARSNDEIYTCTSASVGIDILKGVIDRDGKEQLLTSFNGGSIDRWGGRNVQEFYNIIKGFKSDGTPRTHPISNVFTKHYFDGDPVKSTGWLDSAPCDRHMLLGSGPFNMAPGEEQEVIAAIVAAEGEKRLDALANLYCNDFYIQRFYDFDFKPPKEVPIPEITVYEGDKEIILSWKGNAETYNYKGFKFEGYNVYQLIRPDKIKPQHRKRITTFDIDNDINVLEHYKIHDGEGTYRKTVYQGLGNTGIKRYIKIDKDEFFTGSYLDNSLINGRPYYFAVSAVAGKKGDINDFLESGIVPLRVVPGNLKPGTEYSASITNTEQYARHSQGKADYSYVKVEVVNPEELRDGEYEVTFLKDNGILKWNLLFNDSPVLINQENISGNYDYPVVNGLLPRVRALQSIETYRSTETKPGSKLKFGGDAYTLGFVNGLARDIWNGGDDYEQYYGNDLEIRFTSESSYASEYNISGDNSSFTGLKLVPFEVWNSEDNVQLASVYYDNEPANGEWRIEDEDHIIIINREYSANSIYRPDDPTATWLLYISKDSQWQEGDWIKIKYDNPVITGEDEFTFRSYAPILDDKELEKEVFKNKIRVVPNPYYGSSIYESGKYGRKIMFSPLPDKCTIRIFDLSGILLRTIEKEGQEPYVFWDLRNDHAMQVTSGIYIYIVKSEDLGATMGKIAVFIDERE